MEARSNEKPAIEGGTPVRRTFLPFFRPSVNEADVDAISDTLRSGWLTLGPRTQEFEAALRGYLGVENVVAVSSCSAAMLLALKAMGIGEGDEVVTSANTFASTVHGILHVGATPVLADIDPHTHCVSAETLAARTTERTRAYLPVHFGGQACDIENIMALAADRNIRVLEDAAHSFGAERNGARIGTFGDATAFSFYATKNLTSGEGGCLATNDDALAESVRRLSYHGMSADSWTRYEEHGSWYYEVDVPGFKYNMSDLLSALGLSQLSRFDELMSARQVVAARLLERLADSTCLDLPVEARGNRHSWHLFVIRLNLERIRIDRAQFIRALAAENIGCSVHFIPIYRHPFFPRTDAADFPNCEDYFSRCVSLPVFPGMTDNDVDDVVTAIERVAKFYAS